MAAICCVCLISVSNANAMDWRRLESSALNGSTISLDIDSFTIAANAYVIASLLFDYKTVETSGDASYRSEKRRTHFDCRNERLADQTIVRYAGAAGHGEVVASMSRTSAQAEAEIGAMDPGNPEHALILAVCALSTKDQH